MKSCEEYKCKAVDRRILLTGIVVLLFCAGVSVYDPVLGRCRRREDLSIALEVTACDTNNNFEWKHHDVLINVI